MRWGMEANCVPCTTAAASGDRPETCNEIFRVPAILRRGDKVLHSIRGMPQDPIKYVRIRSYSLKEIFWVSTKENMPKESLYSIPEDTEKTILSERAKKFGRKGFSQNKHSILPAQHAVRWFSLSVAVKVGSCQYLCQGCLQLKVGRNYMCQYFVSTIVDGWLELVPRIGQFVPLIMSPFSENSTLCFFSRYQRSL